MFKSLGGIPANHPVRRACNWAGFQIRGPGACRDPPARGRASRMIRRAENASVRSFETGPIVITLEKNMIEAPSTNVVIGHDTTGRFAVGNTLGRGNPHAAQVARLRSAMLAAVSEDDMKATIGKLVEMAKGGDVAAIKLLFDRVLGKVVTVEEPPVGWTPEQRAAKTAEIAERIRRLRLA